MATRAARAAGPLTAYVLHRYDWSESSLILDLFTREQGRLAVAAKGAKRPYSQLRPVLLPFQRLLINLGRPPKVDADELEAGAPLREVQTLRSAEWAGGGLSMLTGSALFSGFYLNELLMKLTARQDPHPELFAVYEQTLPLLALKEETVSQSALRAFELSLLRQLGVLPDLSRVTLTQEWVQAGSAYSLHPEAGVVARIDEEAALDGSVLIGLQAALQHGSLAALRQASEGSLSTLRTVLRALLHYHLGSNQLRTRQVMLGVQSLLA